MVEVKTVNGAFWVGMAVGLVFGVVACLIVWPALWVCG